MNEDTKETLARRAAGALMAMPHENTLRRGAEALREIRLAFVEDVTPALDRVDRAFVGLSFVLACMPYEQRALEAAP